MKIFCPSLVLCITALLIAVVVTSSSIESINHLGEASNNGRSLVTDETTVDANAKKKKEFDLGGGNKNDKNNKGGGGGGGGNKKKGGGGGGGKKKKGGGGGKKNKKKKGGGGGKKKKKPSVFVLMTFRSRSAALSVLNDSENTVTEVNDKFMALETSPAKALSYKKDQFIGLVEPDHLMSIPPCKNGNCETETKVKNFVETLGESNPWGINAVLQNMNHFKNTPANGPKAICVVDTGFDGKHEDLPHDYTTGTGGVGEDWDYDGNGHGTHTAGTVAALGNNNKGVVGVIPDDKDGKFQLMIGKGLNKNGFGSASSIMKAVKSCVDGGANVISLSLGCNNCKTQIEEKFYRQLYKKNILMYAAAGNSGDSERSYPASYPGVVSVASLAPGSWDRSEFSQFNTNVEISGPGTNVKSTTPGDKYKIYSGTSMACPHAAAVATLIWMYFPKCKAYHIRNALDRSAHGMKCDIYKGFGMVQAKDAYDLLAKEGCSDDFGSKEPVGGCEQLNIAPAPVSPPTKKPIKTKKPKNKKSKKTKPPTPAPTFEPTWSPTNTDFPTWSGTDSTSSSATASFTSSGTDTPPTDCVMVQIVIKTDNHPEDTSFRVLDMTDEVIMSEGRMTRANYLYMFDKCVAPGCYQFQIKDEWGDGLCCNWGEGGYEVYYDGEQKAQGTVFVDESVDYFGLMCS